MGLLKNLCLISIVYFCYMKKINLLPEISKDYFTWKKLVFTGNVLLQFISYLYWIKQYFLPNKKNMNFFKFTGKNDIFLTDGLFIAIMNWNILGVAILFWVPKMCSKEICFSDKIILYSCKLWVKWWSRRVAHFKNIWEPLEYGVLLNFRQYFKNVLRSVETKETFWVMLTPTITLLLDNNDKLTTT